jgi:hypothetical protein
MSSQVVVFGKGPSLFKEWLPYHYVALFSGRGGAFLEAVNTVKEFVLRLAMGLLV